MTFSKFSSVSFSSVESSVIPAQLTTISGGRLKCSIAKSRNRFTSFDDDTSHATEAWPAVGVTKCNDALDKR